MLQPVLLRPVAGGTYELIAGERRWRAAQIAGFERVPAVVRAHDDAESLELALIENMAREDLNPVEEARACSLLVEELGLTREDVGRRVGRSRVAVSNLLRILDLPDDVLDLLRRHAQRGPRPRAADGVRPRRPPPPRSLGRRRGLDRPPHRGAARAAEGRSEPAAARPRPAGAASGPGRGRRAGSATPSAARSAPTSGRPAGRRLQGHAGLRVARRGDGPRGAPRGRRARLTGPCAVAIIAPQGRLAQSVRALL